MRSAYTFFCYDPKNEMLVRSFFADIKRSENVPFCIVECDLYEIFLDICREKRILKSIPAMKSGKSHFLKILSYIL